MFQVAQLGVVEAAGHLLAITGDEGNRGPLIQQANGGFDLFGFGIEFGGDDVTDGWHLDSLEGNGRLGAARGAGMLVGRQHSSAWCWLTAGLRLGSAE